jgi:hypothetical protein
MAEAGRWADRPDEESGWLAPWAHGQAACRARSLQNDSSAHQLQRPRTRFWRLELGGKAAVTWVLSGKVGLPEPGGEDPPPSHRDRLAHTPEIS